VGFVTIYETSWSDFDGWLWLVFLFVAIFILFFSTVAPHFRKDLIGTVFKWWLTFLVSLPLIITIVDFNRSTSAIEDNEYKEVIGVVTNVKKSYSPEIYIEGVKLKISNNDTHCLHATVGDPAAVPFEIGETYKVKYYLDKNIITYDYHCIISVEKKVN
jgi:hypothetical protein